MDSSWNLLVIGPHVDWIRNNKKKCVYTILFYSIPGVKIEGAKSGWNCKISALTLFFFGLPSKKPLASRHKKSLYSKTIYTTKQDLGMKPTANGRICIQYFHSKKSFQTSPGISDCSILSFSSFWRLSCAKKLWFACQKIWNSLISMVQLSFYGWWFCRNGWGPLSHSPFNYKLCNLDLAPFYRGCHRKFARKMPFAHNRRLGAIYAYLQKICWAFL